jgi:hypothetical protein
LSAEKGKGRSKQKERKAHHIGQQLKKLTAGFKQKMGEPEKERSPFYMKRRRSGFEASLSPA